MSVKKNQFYVSGMSCDGCVKKATEAVSKVHGYEGSEFNLDAGTAEIIGDIDPQAVTQVLSDTGYPAVVKSD